ncbi:MAG TPA: hypothetical protein VGF79_00815 [Bacteroidia bacterium]
MILEQLKKTEEQIEKSGLSDEQKAALKQHTAAIKEGINSLNSDKILEVIKKLNDTDIK